MYVDPPMGILQTTNASTNNDWDKQPWGKEEFVTMIKKIEAVTTSPATTVFVHLSFRQTKDLQDAAIECGCRWIGFGNAIDTGKHDPGGQHLISSSTPFGVFCVGAFDKAYWFVEKSHTHWTKCNYYVHTGVKRWFRNGHRIVNPCQKPISPIVDYFINKWVPPGGTVLDLCCGVGSVSVAALLSGRNSISVDNRPCQISAAHTRLVGIESLRNAGVDLDAEGFQVPAKKNNDDGQSAVTVAEQQQSEIEEASVKEQETDIQEESSCKTCGNQLDDDVFDCEGCTGTFHVACAASSEVVDEGSCYYCTEECKKIHMVHENVNGKSISSVYYHFHMENG